MLRYPRVGITVKSNLDEKEESVRCITDILLAQGAQIFFDPERSGDAAAWDGFPKFYSENDIDLLVVIGGDGTILRTVRTFSDFSVPILSINRGTIGFLAELEMHEASEEIPRLLSGSGVIESRSLIHVRVERNGETFFQGYALNEAVIAQGTIARLVDLQVSVQSEPLTTFHADGLIIATPTGSTAYSLAAGGPIVHPTLAATILTPINPHSFSQKPVVIPSDQTIDVEILTKHNKFQDANVVLTLDGQVYQTLQSRDRIRICGCAKTVRFLRKAQDTFFHTLRQKLKWGE
jgi:NAD+ kinase